MELSTQKSTSRMLRSWSDRFELTKPGICALCLVVTALGYALGVTGPWLWGRFFATIVGTALVGASCGTLNQYREREYDALMMRTSHRPLPSGKVNALEALLLGIALGVTGLVILTVWVSLLVAALAAFTHVFYVGIYTPCKRLSSLSTLIGAIPGAMPPLIGFAAARGELAAEGLLFFAILFLWQIPHFLAIAWIYRDDYAQGGFKVLTVVDHKELISTRFQIALYLIALLPLTLLPSMWGFAGQWYFYGALILGLTYLSAGLQLVALRTKLQARRLFLVSLVYLPALGFLMVWDRAL